MAICSVLLAAALTRAELIERFKAPPLTKVSGLVQVVADCPAEMRREFQSPIAAFAADVCTTLYRSDRMQPVYFKEPGIIVYIGDGRTNDTRVVVREGVRDSGAKYTRLTLPSPGTADLDRLRTEVVRAYFRAVKDRTVDAAEAERALRAADPSIRADYEYAQIERWLKGEPVDADDEEMIRLCRAVLVPGVARASDVLRFADRLVLYPEYFDRPFCGRFRACTLKDAILHLKEDPRLRLHAYIKAPQVVAYGGGRGEELAAAAEAYSKLLFEMARGEKPTEDLLAMLEEADIKLDIALEEARKREGVKTK